MTIDLAGKHVIVTGGTHGIGAAAVDVCLAGGASVSICARNGEEVRAAAEARGPAAFGAACDVSEESAVHAFFSAAEGRFGSVAGVIHCAAVLGAIGPITDVDAGAWLSTVKVDLFGAFLVLRESCRRMRAAGGGRIALLSGGGAAAPFPNYTAYACSKAGVVRLVETAAIEMAEAMVEINAVAPGFVATRMHEETIAAGDAAGAGYLARTKSMLASGAVPPETGARCAAWLISDAARGITGKFVAAPYDGYAAWPGRLEALTDSDLFTLRRIVPHDRGLNWQ